MLNQIVNIIKDQATKAVMNNPEIPAEQKDQTVKATTEAVSQGLTDHLSISSLSNISDLFSNDTKVSAMSNPLLETVKNTVTNLLMQKAGLSNSVANGISASVIPAVFNAFSGQVNNPGNEGFNLKTLLNTFTNERSNQKQSGSLLGAIGQLFK